MTKSLSRAGLLASVLVLAAAPSLAHAQDGHSLALTGPASATVGQPAVLQATGTVPDGLLLNRYVNVYAIPTSVVTACPGLYENAMQLAYASSAQGGDTVANHVQVEGNFSAPIAYTAKVAGDFLLCGYLHEGVETMATAQHAVSVTAPAGGETPPTTATKPANVGKPKVRRAGRRLTCTRGTWSGSPTRYTYRWRVNGKPKGAARTLRVTRKLKGRTVRCAVTASNVAGSTTVLSKKLRVR